MTDVKPQRGAHYYNEHEPFAAEWLANLGRNGLIPEGFVDDRDIQQVGPEDVRSYTQCHFFAGIGGWSAALALAGWPADRPVWTGSCPCQPFSCAGKRQGESDERHVWPEFFRLIRECRPSVIFGEQVASKDGLGWLDGVFADLEGIDYACGAADLPAAGVGAPDKRQRLFWVAYACDSEFGWWSESEREQRESLYIANGSQSHGMANAGPSSAWGNSRPSSAHAASGIIQSERGQQTAIQSSGCRETNGLADAAGYTGPEYVDDTGERAGSSQADSAIGGGAGRLEHSSGDGWQQGRAQSERGSITSGCSLDGMGDSSSEGLARRESFSGNDGAQQPPIERTGSNAWAQFEIIACLDGKSRRVGRGVQPLAYGIPIGLGRGKPWLRAMVKSARANRVGRLRGYGNAICPQVAAEFVMAFMDLVHTRSCDQRF